MDLSWAMIFSALDRYSVFGFHQMFKENSYTLVGTITYPLRSDDFPFPFWCDMRVSRWVVSTIFYFHPYLGKISNLTNIFHGLKPPTGFPIQTFYSVQKENTAFFTLQVKPTIKDHCLAWNFWWTQSLLPSLKLTANASCSSSNHWFFGASC